MKIVVIGGSGFIGSKLVKNLRKRGHNVVAASPASGGEDGPQGATFESTVSAKIGTRRMLRARKSAAATSPVRPRKRTARTSFGLVTSGESARTVSKHAEA